MNYNSIEKKQKSAFITYVLWNTKLNGGNKIAITHLQRLNNLNFKVNLLTITPNRAKWIPNEIKKRSILWYIKSFINGQKNILVATFWPTAFLVALLPAKKKYYFIQNWESDFYKNPFLKYLVKFSLKLPLQKITISNFLKTKLKENHLTDKPIIIQNALGRLYQSRGKQNRKKENNKIKVLSVLTSYDRYKGVDILEEIIINLKSKYPNKYFFTLVSTNRNPYSKNFDQFVSNPSQEKLKTVYLESDIFLHTSRVEGFPLPPLEAMNCGCLVIALNSGGINEYAVNNYNSIILENQALIWKKNIFSKIMKDKILKNKLIENGYKTADKFRWSKIDKTLIEIFSKKI